MKNLSLTLLFSLLFVSFACLACPPPEGDLAHGRRAQQDTVKVEYRWGIGVNINTIGQLPSLGLANITQPYKYLNGGKEKDKSFSIGINVNYFIANETALRLKFLITKRKYLEYRDDKDLSSISERIDDIEITESDFQISPGFFYHWRKGKFEIIGGFDLEYIIHSETELKQIVTSTFANPSSNYVVQNTITAPKGSSYGFGGFMGFNLFPLEFISVGLEFSSSFIHTKIGDMVSIETIIISGNLSPVQTIYYEDSINRSGFTEVKSSFNIAYWF